MDNENQNLILVRVRSMSQSSIEDNSSDPEEEDRDVEGDQDGGTVQEPEVQPVFGFRASEPSRHNYDPDLPSLHTYLGADTEVVRGRTVLEDGAEVMLNLLQPVDVVLMPGQTLPLSAFDAPTINMLRSCLKNDRTFGVLASWTEGHNSVVNPYGTTAEIYEYIPESGPLGFRIKAKARQRFKLLNSETSRSKGLVRILPEVKLPDALQGVQLQSLYRHRASPSPTHRHRYRRMDAAVTPWPSFVYEQYDVKRLMAGIKKALTSTLEHRDKEKMSSLVKTVIPDDPTELSFWVAQNVPMLESHRLQLLRLNSPIQRLRWELQALHKCLQVFCCNFCLNYIGSCDDMFSMSVEGPQGTYVNPGGYLHETITLYKVKSIYSVGPPSTEFSWFPGYAWSICKCRTCNQHMGWKFTATNSRLKPHKFWGLCRRSLTLRMEKLSEETRLVF